MMKKFGIGRSSSKVYPQAALQSPRDVRFSIRADRDSPDVVSERPVLSPEILFQLRRACALIVQETGPSDEDYAAILNQPDPLEVYHRDQHEIEEVREQASQSQTSLPQRYSTRSKRDSKHYRENVKELNRLSRPEQPYVDPYDGKPLPSIQGAAERDYGPAKYLEKVENKSKSKRKTSKKDQDGKKIKPEKDDKHRSDGEKRPGSKSEKKPREGEKKRRSDKQDKQDKPSRSYSRPRTNDAKDDRIPHPAPNHLKTPNPAHPNLYDHRYTNQSSNAPRAPVPAHEIHPAMRENASRNNATHAPVRGMHAHEYEMRNNREKRISALNPDYATVPTLFPTVYRPPEPSQPTGQMQEVPESQSGSRPDSRMESRPQSRASSLFSAFRDGFRDYIKPRPSLASTRIQSRLGSRDLSRADSRADSRTGSRAGSQGSSRPGSRGGTYTPGGRSWFGLRRKTSWSSFRSGDSQHDEKAPARDKGPDLNRSLPPLPGLDQYKEPKKHIVHLMSQVVGNTNETGSPASPRVEHPTQSFGNPEQQYEQQRVDTRPSPPAPSDHLSQTIDHEPVSPISPRKSPIVAGNEHPAESHQPTSNQTVPPVDAVRATPEIVPSSDTKSEKEIRRREKKEKERVRKEKEREKQEKEKEREREKAKAKEELEKAREMEKEREKQEKAQEKAKEREKQEQLKEDERERERIKQERAKEREQEKQREKQKKAMEKERGIAEKKERKAQENKDVPQKRPKLQKRRSSASSKRQSAPTSPPTAATMSPPIPPLSPEIQQRVTSITPQLPELRFSLWDGKPPSVPAKSPTGPATLPPIEDSQESPPHGNDILKSGTGDQDQIRSQDTTEAETVQVSPDDKQETDKEPSKKDQEAQSPIDQFPSAAEFEASVQHRAPESIHENVEINIAVTEPEQKPAEAEQAKVTKQLEESEISAQASEQALMNSATITKPTNKESELKVESVEHVPNEVGSQATNEMSEAQLGEQIQEASSTTVVHPESRPEMSLRAESQAPSDRKSATSVEVPIVMMSPVSPEPTWNDGTVSKRSSASSFELLSARSFPISPPLRSPALVSQAERSPAVESPPIGPASPIEIPPVSRSPALETSPAARSPPVRSPSDGSTKVRIPFSGDDSVPASRVVSTLEPSYLDLAIKRRLQAGQVSSPLAQARGTPAIAAVAASTEGTKSRTEEAAVINSKPGKTKSKGKAKSKAKGKVKQPSQADQNRDSIGPTPPSKSPRTLELAEQRRTVPAQNDNARSAAVTVPDADYERRMTISERQELVRAQQSLPKNRELVGAGALVGIEDGRKLKSPPRSPEMAPPNMEGRKARTSALQQGWKPQQDAQVRPAATASVESFVENDTAIARRSGSVDFGMLGQQQQLGSPPRQRKGFRNRLSKLLGGSGGAGQQQQQQQQPPQAGGT